MSTLLAVPFAVLAVPFAVFAVPFAVFAVLFAVFAVLFAVLAVPLAVLAVDCAEAASIIPWSAVDCALFTWVVVAKPFILMLLKIAVPSI